ncbi:MAG TPA: flagellar hook-basal body protein [Steroidobacteraceae bacterium]|nr:flagellar hook-basal body protein [Steroidobacteraceae bacterium]
MSDTISTLAAAMRADADAVRMIGQNVANADVTAYRRQVPVQSTTFAELIGDSAVSTEAAIDRRAGTLKTTGEPLNLALEGDGFFVLQASGGRSVYTRRGDFRVSAEGLLTAASGEPVLGASGPIQIGSAIPSIEPDGTVRSGADAIDQLQIMHFGDESKLQYLGNGLYADTGDAAASDAGYAIVRQGFLETSNVAPVTEMVQLMETMRHFEAAQRMVRGYDELLQKAISELGKAR